MESHVLSRTGHSSRKSLKTVFCKAPRRDVFTNSNLQHYANDIYDGGAHAPGRGEQRGGGRRRGDKVEHSVRSLPDFAAQRAKAKVRRLHISDRACRHVHLNIRVNAQSIHTNYHLLGCLSGTRAPWWLTFSYPFSRSTSSSSFSLRTTAT